MADGEQYPICLSRRTRAVARPFDQTGHAYLCLSCQNQFSPTLWLDPLAKPKEANVAKENLICPNCEGEMLKTLVPSVDPDGQKYDCHVCVLCSSSLRIPKPTKPEKQELDPGRPEPPGETYHLDAPLFTYALGPEASLALWTADQRAFGVRRSNGWPALEHEHLRLHPNCVVCGTKTGCVGHHIIPFHVNPNRELDPENLATLCPPHHLLVGHLMNWASYNDRVVEIAAMLASLIRTRPTKTISIAPV